MPGVCIFWQKFGRKGQNDKMDAQDVFSLKCELDFYWITVVSQKTCIVILGSDSVFIISHQCGYASEI